MEALAQQAKNGQKKCAQNVLVILHWNQKFPSILPSFHFIFVIFLANFLGQCGLLLEAGWLREDSSAALEEKGGLFQVDFAVLTQALHDEVHDNAPLLLLDGFRTGPLGPVQVFGLWTRRNAFLKGLPSRHGWKNEVSSANIPVDLSQNSSIF